MLPLSTHPKKGLLAGWEGLQESARRQPSPFSSALPPWSGGLDRKDVLRRKWSCCLAFVTSIPGRSGKGPSRDLRAAASPAKLQPRLLGTGRPFCACASRVAPPSARRPRLPPILKVSVSGPTGFQPRGDHDAFLIRTPYRAAAMGPARPRVRLWQETDPHRARGDFAGTTGARGTRAQSSSSCPAAASNSIPSLSFGNEISLSFFLTG